MSLKSIDKKVDAIVDAMVETVDELLTSVEPPCVLTPVVRLTDEKVDEMVESGTFADLMMLAVHFWELPQATRLMVLHKTTVDPFIIHDNFYRFFNAFGFHTYFAKYAVIRDDAVRNELCEKEFNSLIATMQSQLREVILFQRPVCPVSLKESFCKNAEHYNFLLPFKTGMDKDYEEVQRIVRLMAFELQYPEFAASITQEDRKVHYEVPRPLKKKHDSFSSSSSSTSSSSSSSSSDSDSEDEKKKCTKSSKDKKIECTNQ